MQNFTDIPGRRSYIDRLYPAAAVFIRQEAEKEADRLDYEGSLLYDEYPDRESLLRVTDQMYRRISEPLGRIIAASGGTETPSDESRLYIIWLVQVIFYNELEKRRRNQYCP